MVSELGQRDILLLFSQLLNKHQIPYLLTGSFASSYYGYPRATHDIDLIIEIGMEKLDKLNYAIGELDDKIFLIDWDQMRLGIEKKSQFNLYHADSGVKIDFWPVADNDFEQSKFQRKKEVRLFGKNISIISPEDLILTKLLWCKTVKSEKHMRDCKGIMKIQTGRLDGRYLDSWSKKLGVTHLLSFAFHCPENNFNNS